MVQPEHHSQGEDLEESEKDVARGHGAESQGQEGCQTAVENCRADADQSRDGLLQSVTCRKPQLKPEVIIYWAGFIPLETSTSFCWVIKSKTRFALKFKIETLIMSFMKTVSNVARQTGQLF